MTVLRADTHSRSGGGFAPDVARTSAAPRPGAIGCRARSPRVAPVATRGTAPPMNTPNGGSLRQHPRQRRRLSARLRQDRVEKCLPQRLFFFAHLDMTWCTSRQPLARLFAVEIHPLDLGVILLRLLVLGLSLCGVFARANDLSPIKSSVEFLLFSSPQSHGAQRVSSTKCGFADRGGEPTAVSTFTVAVGPTHLRSRRNTRTVVVRNEALALSSSHARNAHGAHGRCETIVLV